MQCCAIFQFAGVLAYNMSKSAIDQFTRCIALGKVKHSSFTVVLAGMYTYDPLTEVSIYMYMIQ